MRQDFAMVWTVLAVSALCGLARGSIEHGHGAFPIFAAPGVPVVPPPPVVAATSSQYFERNFNRLVLPPAVQPVPIAPQPPVFIQPTPNAVPVAPVTPTASEPVQPNVAIAVATTHIAAPVATILLPPYPFGSPLGFIPPSPPINVPDDTKESTTPTTTTVEAKTTTSQPEQTTPVPAGSENNFNVQALPSNQNVNFNQAYGPPLPQYPPYQKPQKYKTTVEVVPVPLTYIAPPPLKLQAFKTIKHVHAFVPLKAKLIIRPVYHASLKIRAVRRPGKLVYRAPLTDRAGSSLNVRRPVSREIEPTTFRPSVKPATKPPRI